ncbi:MAG: hypothetical protein M3178_00455 [Pseudomonadota bacterium]|nr:hypothetical protein [Pseudomonadota bacterium]
MDAMIFLKSAPAVIGIAGLLTYFMMRAREPVSDLEREYRAPRSQHIFATRVRGVNHAKCVAHSSARATGSRYSLAAGVSRIECALNCRRRDLLQCRARQQHVEDFG